LINFIRFGVKVKAQIRKSPDELAQRALGPFEPLPTCATIVPVHTTLMLVSEAMVMLAPYGVERIKMIPSHHPDGTPTWRVTQNGVDYFYCSDLSSVVWALTPDPSAP
jgi:hypothetical protein